MKDFDTIYQTFKSVSQTDANAGFLLLIELANQFSNNERLQSEAVLLHSEYSSAVDNTVLKERLLLDMYELADNIKQEQDNTPILGTENKALQQIWLDKRQPKKNIFKCSGVFKRYPHTNFELKKIGLCLKAGEITGVVGENGNGKTTLLKIIAGEIAADAGSLQYNFLPTPALVNWGLVRQQVAFLPQELGRFTGSVRNSVQYAAALHGIRGEQNDIEVEYIIQRLGLGKYKDARWDELSGGYKLRFALARVLVWKPKLLVLDEPLANLDINTQVKVLNDLRNLCQSIRNPIAIILSSQNIEEVEAVSDNMIVLSNGEMRYNDLTANLGDNRGCNMYEFKTLLPKEELERKFAGLEYLGLDYNGFSFFIKTALNITETGFLRYCMDNDIPLHFFQNIGVSTKSLIVQTSL